MIVVDSSALLCLLLAEDDALRITQALVDAERCLVVPFDDAQAQLATEAFLRFGKGRHPAKLNFGDCATYALAKSRDLPLLFKGGDFGLTDARRVV